MYVIIQEAVFIELRFSNEVERTLCKNGFITCRKYYQNIFCLLLLAIYLSWLIYESEPRLLHKQLDPNSQLKFNIKQVKSRLVRSYAWVRPEWQFFTTQFNEDSLCRFLSSVMKELIFCFLLGYFETIGALGP